MSGVASGAQHAHGGGVREPAVRVSFVIPTRNQAGFLRRCIDSCLAQQVEDAEVVVVDGCSTDGTQAVLAGYGDRIHWTSEPDSGQAEAVNKGVARARGELIAWINSDDAYARPDAVRLALREFEVDAEVDLVFGQADVIDAGGQFLRPYARRAFTGARDLLVAPIGPPQPAVFFRKELYLAVGGLRPDLHYALDYDLMLRLFGRARRIRHLPVPLALMTFHADAKSIRAMGLQIREAAAIKRAHAAGLRLGLLDRARMGWAIAALHLYRLAVRLGLRRVS